MSPAGTERCYYAVIELKFHWLVARIETEGVTPSYSCMLLVVLSCLQKLSWGLKNLLTRLPHVGSSLHLSRYLDASTRGSSLIFSYELRAADQMITSRANCDFERLPRRMKELCLETTGAR